MIKKILEKHSDKFYFVFRVLVGVLFMLHGVQKMQGIIGGKMQLLSLVGLAGVIEIVGGTFLVIGLFTQYAALISGVEMIFAYFMAHFPQSLNPLTNKGEAALLFLGAFLVLASFGSKKWAVDEKLKR